MDGYSVSVTPYILAQMVMELLCWSISGLSVLLKGTFTLSSLSRFLPVGFQLLTFWSGGLYC